MMSKTSTRRDTFAALVAQAILCSVLFPPVVATASRAVQREHLTAQEIERVRDNQELSKRTDVFIKAAERRLLALTDPAAAARQAQKDSELWGDLAASQRPQLIADLAKILEEAVTNIDDTALKTQNKSLLTKSLNKLSQAAARFLPQLAAMRERTPDENERNQLELAIETAEEIIAAATKHPVVEEEKNKKAKGKS